MWRDVLFAKVADWRVPAGEYVNTHSKLSPFDIYMLQRGSRTRSCNKDIRGLAHCKTKATLIHAVEGKEVSVGNVCHAEEKRLLRVELCFAPEENTGLFAAALMPCLTSSNELNLKLI